MSNHLFLASSSAYLPLIPFRTVVMPTAKSPVELSVKTIEASRYLSHSLILFPCFAFLFAFFSFVFIVALDDGFTAQTLKLLAICFMPMVSLSLLNLRQKCRNFADTKWTSGSWLFLLAVLLLQIFNIAHALFDEMPRRNSFRCIVLKLVLSWFLLAHLLLLNP